MKKENSFVGVQRVQQTKRRSRIPPENPSTPKRAKVEKIPIYDDSEVYDDEDPFNEYGNISGEDDVVAESDVVQEGGGLDGDSGMDDEAEIEFAPLEVSQGVPTSQVVLHKKPGG